MIRKLLAQHPPLIGTLVTINSCELVEALMHAGVQWLFFDLEHGAYSLSDVQNMVRVVKPPCLSFIRIQEAQPVYVKKALDTGCDGIIVPQVNSAATAIKIVEAGRYAPLGQRSVGLSRSTAYGAGLTDAIQAHNREKSIIVQIEHADAVKNLEEILSVEGIDGVFVGPYDLSSSMGCIGQVQDERVQAAIGQVQAAAAAKGLISGIFVGNDQAMVKEAARGFQMIAVGSDCLRLIESCRTSTKARDDTMSRHL